MDPDRARALAELLHRDDRALLAHIRRVARATPAEAHAVAWLHEALEASDVSEQTLLLEGLTTGELRAIRLLTAGIPTRSDDTYLARLAFIGRAAGRSGDLARLVKIADLRDRQRHPRRRGDGWSPPYAAGLRLLLASPGGPVSGHFSFDDALA
jgi:hypothetical protein